MLTDEANKLPELSTANLSAIASLRPFRSVPSIDLVKLTLDKATELTALLVTATPFVWIDVVSIANPPIAPPFAVMLPTIFTDDAYKIPELSTANLSAIASLRPFLVV